MNEGMDETMNEPGMDETQVASVKSSKKASTSSKKPPAPKAKVKKLSKKEEENKKLESKFASLTNNKEEAIKASYR